MIILIVFNLFQFLSSENINSCSKIYDSDGNGKFYTAGLFESDDLHEFLERSSLILKQSEWNIVKMGTEKFLNKCKRVHFKNIAVESKARDFWYSR